METKFKTILIVEDSDFLRLMLKKLFNTQGFKVLVAKDGVEAIQLVNEMPPDLIISDYLVPFKNGMDIFKYTQTHSINKIPFILVSKLKKAEIEKFHSTDSIPIFINKPVNLRMLLSYCDHLLN